MNTVAPCLRPNASTPPPMAPPTLHHTPTPPGGPGPRGGPPRPGRDGPLDCDLPARAGEVTRARPRAVGRERDVGRRTREMRQPVAKPRLGVTRLGVLPG